MKLNSNSFNHGDAIPGKYAFAVIADPIALSTNHNPHLAWENVPEGCRSFVLTVIDPDVPSIGDNVNQLGKTIAVDLPRVDFSHWLLVNLPSHHREIEAGSFSEGITARGKSAVGLFNTQQGLNDYTGWFAQDADMAGQYFGYDGPCPPWNDERMHQYIFTLYALDVEYITLQEDFSASDLLAAIAPHILAKATLTGRYTLNPSVSY